MIDDYRQQIAGAFGLSPDLFKKAESSAMTAEREVRAIHSRRIVAWVQLFNAVESLRATLWLIRAIPRYNRYLRQYQRSLRRGEPLERGTRERRRKTYSTLSRNLRPDDAGDTEPAIAGG